jgi:hypothetical protein
MLAQQYILQFEKQEMSNFESPFYALSLFIRSMLEPEHQGATFPTEVDVNREETMKQGKHFRAEVGFYCLRTLCHIAPVVWQPALLKITEVVQEHMFASKSARATETTQPSGPGPFQETYYCLYEDLKKKYTALVASTTEMRSAFVQ